MIAKEFNIYLDLDGTCNKFEYVGPDKYSDPNYYRTRPVQEQFVNGLKKLSEQNKYTFYVVSSKLQGDGFAEAKNDWSEKYLPFVKPENRIYVEYGQSKLEGIKKHLKSQGKSEVKGIMLDDYTKNLWEFNGSDILPVKVLNGINDTHKSWTGIRVTAYGEPDAISYTLDAISDMWAA